MAARGAGRKWRGRKRRPGPPPTAGEVWQTLRREFAKLADYTQPPMIAVNESYADPGVRLRDGDELAFIPPVAGG